MMGDEIENRCHVTLTWNDTGEKVQYNTLQFIDQFSHRGFSESIYI